MTTPHKATPWQWSQVEEWVRVNESSSDSCILELRDRLAAAEQRIQALEVTQHAHVKALRMSDTERERLCAELTKPGRVEPLKAGTTCPHIITSDEGTSYCGLAEQGNRQGSLDSSPGPAGGLVERVQHAISHTYPDDARAAILAVAEWLENEYGMASMLAASWLREEVNRHA